VLAWFHLSMRIRHVAQAAERWPDATPEDREEGTSLAETIELICWPHWHGQVNRGLDLVGATAATLKAKAETASLAASAALKVRRLLGDLINLLVNEGWHFRLYGRLVLRRPRWNKEPIPTIPPRTP